MWEIDTNRNCLLVNDDMTGSFECKWQVRATQQLGYEHISMFCSLGEWANNISDILKDDNIDYCNFLNDEDRQLCLDITLGCCSLCRVVCQSLCRFSGWPVS